MGFIKTSIDGLNGSGKTGTAARLAVGLSKEYGGSAPVVAFDSEERWRFTRPIFLAEKVELVIVTGQSLLKLQESIDHAAKLGACVFVGDQLTTPWLEGLKSFSHENGALPFDRRAQLMALWDEFVRSYRYGKFHAIACGRLGYQWENIEDENGQLVLTQGDSKFNAGGGNNFGYEADLELEIRRRKRKIAGLFRGKTTVEHVCDVIKDAASVLSGEQFTFEEKPGAYKPGDYLPVLNALRPHIELVKQLDSGEPDLSTTKQLIVGGKTAWAKDQSERASLLQELEANLDISFGSKQSTQGKMFRNLTLEYLNGFISWGRMEEETPTHDIERNVLIVKALRKRIEGGEIPTEQSSLSYLLNLSTDDVLHPGHGKTLLEVMGVSSIKAATAKKKSNGAQPIVAVMDKKAIDELEA